MGFKKKQATTFGNLSSLTLPKTGLGKYLYTKFPNRQKIVARLFDAKEQLLFYLRIMAM